MYKVQGEKVVGNYFFFRLFISEDSFKFFKQIRTQNGFIMLDTKTNYQTIISPKLNVA